MNSQPIFGSNEGPRLDAGALWLSAGLLVVGCAAQLAGEAVAIGCGLAMFVAGLAHGAGDENGGAMRAYTPLLVLAYIVTGLAIAALFLAAPIAGLALFLGLSAWHFARSDSGFGRLANLSVALLAVGGSALLRSDATVDVFATILGQTPPRLLIITLRIAGGAGVILGAWLALQRKRGGLAAGFAIMACALFHPILAVGSIFLGMHALPIQRRQIARYGLSRVLSAVAAPTVVATLGAVALAIAVWQDWLAMELAIAFAFGMATPHMLTERLEH